MLIDSSSAYTGGYYSTSIDDASISAQVRGLLASHLSTRHINPTVRTSEGVVTLNGTAVNADERAWITRLAEDVHGVKSVNNNMALGERQHATASSTADGQSMVGAAGPQGPKGRTGDKGDKGATGASGASVTGAEGAKGATGSAGRQGLTGATGATGNVVRGAAGATGAMGAEGAEGVQGATGATGQSEIGARGATGATGRAGDQGVTGEAGATGETLVGPTGPAGRAGEAGARGAGGESGERGATTVGATGATGAAGVSGKRGGAGATGSRGSAGAITEWTTYRAFWFQTNSLDLRDSDQLQIDEIADYAKKNSSLKLGIDGSIPADSGDNNEEWADRRVKVVREALIKAGVPASRIESGRYNGDENARRGRVEVLLRTDS
jgi:outer membrane protein OmpA-like peptidoglycan-associated protein